MRESRNGFTLFFWNGSSFPRMRESSNFLKRMDTRFRVLRQAQGEGMTEKVRSAKVLKSVMQWMQLFIRCMLCPAKIGQDHAQKAVSALVAGVEGIVFGLWSVIKLNETNF